MRVLLKGGDVHEGTGSPPKPLDLVIKGDQIQTLCAPGTASGRFDRAIDCSGKDITPGFINVHSHIDFSLVSPEKRPMSEAVCQGITTEVVGHCGQSAIPMKGERQELVQDYMEYFLTPLGTTPAWQWTGFDEFAEVLQTHPGLGANICVLVGHTNLRLAVMGYASRPATQDEIKTMGSMLAEELANGAYGLSSGLQWAPSFFALNSELIDLAKVVSSFEGIYTTHMRAEGDMVLEALEEAIEVARATQLPVHVSHLKAAGKANWGKVHAALEMIDRERDRGIDIAPDKQPYVVENMGLRAILPPWIIVDAGGVEGLREKLRSENGRAEVKEEITNRQSRNWDSCIVDGVWDETGWDGLIIDGCPTRPEWEMKSVKQIAEEEKKHPWDLVLDLLAEGKEAPTAMFAFESEDDLRTLYDYPNTICASDYFGKNHPRNWGTFPRFLGRLAEREGWLPFEEALRRVTSLPAERCRIPRRGSVVTGNFADLVVLDRKNLIDEGTFDDPSQTPSGIESVFVNGVEIVTGGQPVTVSELPGKVLRRGGTPTLAAH